jgi:hypothetical protein
MSTCVACASMMLVSDMPKMHGALSEKMLSLMIEAYE